jgi:hypothetical protein
MEIPLAGYQSLLRRVGDEHLENRSIQALTAPLPLGGMPSVLPNVRAMWRCTPARRR